MRHFRLGVAVVLAGFLAGCGGGGGAVPDTAAVSRLVLNNDGIARPNPALTPGAAVPGVTTEQVCAPGYAGPGRKPSLLDEQSVFQLYLLDYPASLTGHRVDQLIPGKLGGTDTLPNLWPEPTTPQTAGRKDELADWLHQLVCSGAVPLEAAQRQVADDWYAAWLRYGGASRTSQPLTAVGSGSTAPAPGQAPTGAVAAAAPSSVAAPTGGSGAPNTPKPPAPGTTSTGTTPAAAAPPPTSPAGFPPPAPVPLGAASAPPPPAAPAPVASAPGTAGGVPPPSVAAPSATRTPSPSPTAATPASSTPPNSPPPRTNGPGPPQSRSVISPAASAPPSTTTVPAPQPRLGS